MTNTEFTEQHWYCIEQFLYMLKEKMNQSQWLFIVKKEFLPDDDECMAKIWFNTPKRDAVIMLNKGFLDQPAHTQKRILIHEMAHTIFGELVHAVTPIYDELGAQAHKIGWKHFQDTMEYATDNLAMAFYHLVPDIDWTLTPPGAVA